MPWFVKIERGIVPKPVFDRSVPAHLAWVRSLHLERRAITGYWAERGGGMLLFEAESRAEAERIVAQDPLIRDGCVEHELHEWRVVAGALPRRDDSLAGRAPLDDNAGTASPPGKR